MWPRTHAVTLSAALSIAACTSTADPSADAGAICPAGLPDSSACPDSAPSYASDVRPIIDDLCMGCHYAGYHYSTQVLATYDNLHRSVSLIEKEVYGCDMPPSGEPQLTTEERQTLLEWLVCGGPNN